MCLMHNILEKRNKINLIQKWIKGLEGLLDEKDEGNICSDKRRL